MIKKHNNCVHYEIEVKILEYQEQININNIIICITICQYKL
jgi:hypothetical protein